MCQPMQERVETLYRKTLENISKILHHHRIGIDQLLKHAQNRGQNDGLVDGWLSEAETLKEKLHDASRQSESGFNLIDEAYRHLNQTISSLEEAIASVDTLIRTMQTHTSKEDAA